MATVLLSAVGSAVGGSLGGTVLGISAASLGQAAGGLAGAVLDQAILGGGSAAVEVGRARSLRVQSSTEGEPIPQVFGRTRLPGQLIWSTRFRENVRATTQGGKGTSQRVREYSYSISFAVALAEGPIERVGRIWADGKLMDLTGVIWRLYRGDEAQLPDPKIEAVEGAGNVPAYRGTAYLVFEDLPLAPYGNRIPQINAEIFRSPSVTVTGEEAGPRLSELVRGVALSPGTGEFALDPEPARIVFPAGGGRYANINNAAGLPDMAHALEQLDADLPRVETVSLIVSWFGDDLRAGNCTVRPRIEETGRAYAPEPWSTAGLTTATATAVSRDPNGRPNFGGSPSDGSVIRAVQALSARGKKVVLYPFLLMDITEGNGLPDPYGRPEQPVFPWRGRITGSDLQPVAAAEVAAFFGTARASDFAVAPGSVTYSGPEEWGWRRFILHLAGLCAAAGGVHAFCIGSELRGLTTLRSGPVSFPAVDQLIALAAEVRALLPDALITYAADWSEYFGHQPQDGSGDVLFHLDPLWADANIDMVGIDDYTPLSDWRHASSHADAAAKTVYSLPYLRGNVEGGEHYAFYYASDSDRKAQVRTAIADGAHGEDFVFRPKDIRGWWQNVHHNRVGGVRQAQPTAWVPQSKPVWLTETGCPAVDLGANQPNVFYDGRSSESALPYHSRGARDDEMQRRFLQAKLGYWADHMPVSSVYGGPMIPEDGILIWTWDARPWPDFPVRESLWADGPAHRLGHWITGRVAAGSLAEVVSEICLSAGLSEDEIDVSRLFGTVDGYLIERTGTAREALQPLMQAYGFDAYESGGRLVFATRAGAVGQPLDPARFLPGEGADAAPVTRIKARLNETADAIRFGYVQAENDYRVGAAEARLPGGPLTRVSQTSLALSLPGSQAQAVAERWLAEQARGQERVRFALPPSALAWEPGDVVQLPGSGQIEQYRIERISDAAGREVEAVRVEPALYLPKPAPERRIEPQASQPPGPVTALVMDLPLGDHRPHVAAASEPWPGEMAVYRAAGTDGFEEVAALARPAILGALAEPLPVGQPNRWHRVSVRAFFPAGGVSGADPLAVLNGANRVALELPGGDWEIAQFAEATLIGQDEYRIGRLLRGQRGSDAFLAAAPAGTRLVLLDGAVGPVALDEAERGLTRTWRIGPARFGLAHPAYQQIVTAVEGAGLRPFAPVHLKSRRRGGDLHLSWVRRTRVGGDSWIGADVPLGEEREIYRLRVLGLAGVLRSVEVTAPAFVYTAAMQAEDGPASAVAVSQLSTAYGYGPERTINV